MVSRYWGRPGEKSVTREQLYEMVWTELVTRVAPRFGISDVALRKICVKHQIPTPDLGYWAKLQHGKRVTKKALPALRKEEDRSLYLFERPVPEVPAVVAEAGSFAKTRESAEEAKIVVPAARPGKLHHTAVSVERVLKRAKEDDEGFVECSGPGLVPVTIGRASIERVTILVDAFLNAVKVRGYAVADDDHGITVDIDGELFRFGLVETKDQKPHVPTPAELKEQERAESWRLRMPSLYPDPKRKTYRTWDKYPSGRLSMTVWGVAWNQWRGAHDVSFAGRWYDRPNRPVEQYLNAALVAASTTAAAIKHGRALAAEKARLEAEEADRRAREAARRHRIDLRQKFLRREARHVSSHLRLEELSRKFGEFASKEGNEPVDQLYRVLAGMVREGQQRYDRTMFNEEIKRLGLIGEDDAL